MKPFPTFLFIVSFLFCTLEVMAHGNHHYSKFIITEADNNFELNIEILKDDFDMLQHDFTAFGNNDEERLMHYLKSHFCLSFNGRSVELESIMIERGETHLLVKVKLASSVHEVQKVTLFNTCFLNLVEEHINVAVFQINGSERYFNLDENRKQTQFAYN